MATTMDLPTASFPPVDEVGPDPEDLFGASPGAPPGDGAVSSDDPAAPVRPGWGRRLWRGPEADPAWARPALWALLGATAVLYLWGLGASGWANSFYSAAVQAGTHSWKAFFFGSSDSSNSITVDKPPMSLWVMGLSARAFGVNAWSILAPQALEGVASVALLYAAVKRWYGAAAGLLAGAVLAVTPVATLMFRFNNPDALLVLMLVGAAYALLRSLEGASTRWLVLAWALVGSAFLTKMLQALLVAPAFALVYLVCAPTSFRRRFVQSIYGFIALVVSAGWWVAIAELWPASSRPYIGGSQHNSVLELIVGYNGLGRLTGNETGSVGGGGAGGPGGNAGGMWGPTGWTRMFNSSFGAQASWLLPTALLLLVIGLALRGRAGRTDRSRAAYLVWGGWLVVTTVAFSLGKGIIHEYYTVALAPAIGALVGMGATDLWRRRDHVAARIGLGASMAVTAWWASTLLRRTPDRTPWLATVVLFGGLGVAAMLAFAPHLRGRVGTALAIAAVVLGLAAPTAYSLQTASTTHRGSIPTAGPGGRGFGPGGRGGPGGMAGGMPGGMQGGPGAMAGGLPGQTTGGTTTGGTTTGGTTTGGTTTGGFPGGMAGGFPGGMGDGGAGGGGAGGLLDASTPSDEVTKLLQTDADQYTWTAAAIGSNSASGFQLAADEPVMAIGGFNGSDPSPTLAQFQAYVKAGKVHWFIASGMGGGPGMNGSSASSEISSWVQQHFTSTTVGGVTLYDLTSPTSS